MVRGDGFSFDAPDGWKVAVAKRSGTAWHASQLVQVSTFPLMRTYDDALFGKVRKELDARMQAVAGQLKGTVAASSTVDVAGSRAHSYDVKAGGDLLQYTFVLRGKKEYELLCRRPASSDQAPCKQLLTSFSPAL